MTARRLSAEEFFPEYMAQRTADMTAQVSVENVSLEGEKIVIDVQLMSTYIGPKCYRVIYPWPSDNPWNDIFAKAIGNQFKDGLKKADEAMDIALVTSNLLNIH